MEQKIVFPDPPDIEAADRDAVARLAPTVFAETVPVNQKQLVSRLEDATIAVPTWVRMTKEVIEEVIDEADRLKYIIVPAKGVDAVDLQAATENGITVCNCPTHNIDDVAEHTIGLLLGVSRKILEANRDLRAGEWKPKKGIRLRHKTIVVISTSAIGQEVAAMTKALRMHVLTANSKTPPVEIDRMLSAADVVTLHLPLNDSTRNFIDERRLQLMKKGSILINTSRGAIVDETALYDALNSNHLFGAGLNTFSDEPLGDQIPASVSKLVALPNVISTPHTEESIRMLGVEVLAAIESCLKSAPINVVN